MRKLLSALLMIIVTFSVASGGAKLPNQPESPEPPTEKATYTEGLQHDSDGEPPKEDCSESDVISREEARAIAIKHWNTVIPSYTRTDFPVFLYAEFEENRYSIRLSWQRKGQEHALSPFSTIDKMEIDLSEESMSSYATAVQIACDYWDVKRDDAGAMIIEPVSVFVTRSSDEYYTACLIWQRANQTYTVIDEVYIDVRTGQGSVG